LSGSRVAALERVNDDALSVPDAARAVSVVETNGWLQQKQQHLYRLRWLVTYLPETPSPNGISFQAFLKVGGSRW